MSIDFNSIEGILGLLFGGSGIGAIITWKFSRRKAKAEAESQEINVAQEVQETYQKMLADKNEEVSDKNRIINELREDRDHFRQDRNELRARIEKTESTIRELQEKVDANTHEMNLMRPFLCSVLGCKMRQSMDIFKKQSEDK